jgi:F420-dependent oxidoreductase-like protein
MIGATADGDPMRYALMCEPQQGMSYAEVLALAQTAEEVGFESFFRSDHYSSFPGEAGLPTTDAWATLAGIARETTRITLGALVSPATFRLPGNFAKLVTTVSEMSGGRVEVGLGAGWNTLEHEQHGIPYPDDRERFDMLEEQLAILHGLWTEPDGWSYEGKHWTVRDAQFYPKPLAPAGQRHPHIIVGGHGGPRIAALVANYADEINISSRDPSASSEGFDRTAAACRKIDRDPASVTRSVMTGVLVGKTDAEIRDRVSQLMSLFGNSTADAEEWLAERRKRWIIGTPDEARERVESYAAVGTERIMLQTFLPRDLEMVRLLGEVFSTR